jgi:hypothetical protein
VIQTYPGIGQSFQVYGAGKPDSMFNRRPDPIIAAPLTEDARRELIDLLIVIEDGYCDLDIMDNVTASRKWLLNCVRRARSAFVSVGVPELLQLLDSIARDRTEAYAESWRPPTSGMHTEDPAWYRSVEAMYIAGLIACLLEFEAFAYSGYGSWWSRPPQKPHHEAR